MTERQSVEAALRESELRYRTLFNSIDDGFCVCQMLLDEHGKPRDYRFVEVNRTFEQHTGLVAATGRTALELVPDLEPHWVELYGKVAVTGEPLRFEQGSDAMGGRWFDVYAFRFGEPSSLMFGILFTDVTERKAAQGRLRHSEERYRAIVEGQTEMVCRFRLDGTILFVNGAYARARGATPDGLIGVNFWSFIPDLDQPHVRAMLERLSPADPEVRIENRFDTAEGPRWILWTNRGLGFDEHGLATEVQSSGIDITDRKRVEQALADNEASLRHANRMKDEFLATLSHELRTPLNAVLGWAHLLRNGNLTPETMERALDSIERNAKVQTQLVDDLLDMSRIVSGKLQIRFERVDLAAVVSTAVETVLPTARSKGLSLQLWVEGMAPIEVNGDADRLQQIVWNLLSNALKFTPEGGRIDITVRTRGTDAEIVVKDTGEGIPPGFLPFVFDRFRQADATTTRHHGGLGIGLAIVRYLTEAHGGTVTAQSGGPDRGAIFVVRLPGPD